MQRTTHPSRKNGGRVAGAAGSMLTATHPVPLGASRMHALSSRAVLRDSPTTKPCGSQVPSSSQRYRNPTEIRRCVNSRCHAICKIRDLGLVLKFHTFTSFFLVFSVQCETMNTVKSPISFPLVKKTHQKYNQEVPVTQR